MQVKSGGQGKEILLQNKHDYDFVAIGKWRMIIVVFESFVDVLQYPDTF
jgi:hypothetical protein